MDSQGARKVVKQVSSIQDVEVVEVWVGAQIVVEVVAIHYRHPKQTLEMNFAATEVSGEVAMTSRQLHELMC